MILDRSTSLVCIWWSLPSEYGFFYGFYRVGMDFGEFWLDWTGSDLVCLWCLYWVWLWFTRVRRTSMNFFSLFFSLLFSFIVLHFLLLLFLLLVVGVAVFFFTFFFLSKGVDFFFGCPSLLLSLSLSLSLLILLSSFFFGLFGPTLMSAIGNREKKKERERERESQGELEDEWVDYFLVLLLPSSRRELKK